MSWKQSNENATLNILNAAEKGGYGVLAAIAYAATINQLQIEY